MVDGFINFLYTTKLRLFLNSMEVGFEVMFKKCNSTNVGLAVMASQFPIAGWMSFTRYPNFVLDKVTRKRDTLNWLRLSITYFIRILYIR